MPECINKNEDTTDISERIIDVTFNSIKNSLPWKTVNMKEKYTIIAQYRKKNLTDKRQKNILIVITS